MEADNNSIFFKMTYILYCILRKINISLAEKALYIISRRYGTKGSRLRRYGYDHPWSLKFIWKIHRKYWDKSCEEVIEKRTRTLKENSPLRIGIWEGLGTLNRDIFLNVPENVELFLYDIQSRNGKRSVWLEHNVENYYCSLIYGKCINYTATEGWEGYTPIDRGSDCNEECHKLAERINNDQLDILIRCGGINKEWEYTLRYINTPYIAYIPTGSVLAFDEKVDVNYWIQPQKFMEIVDNHMMYSISNKRLSNVPIKEMILPFNNRDIDINENLPISSREKCMIFHGNLYKLCNKYVLDVIAKLLYRYKDYSFCYIGADLQGENKKIQTYFKKRNLDDRIQYLGSFDNGADQYGFYKLSDIEKMFDYVRKSRLYINAWPICGGQSVFQAFRLGVPCPSLRFVSGDGKSKLSDDMTTLELNGLNLKETDTYDMDSYFEMCCKLIDNDDFAETVVKKQIQVTENILDSNSFWKQIIMDYQNSYVKGVDDKCS